MNVLAVDTSGSFLNVALKTDTFYEQFCSESPANRHSENLMPKILEFCSKTGIGVDKLDFLACTRGPGSFTGLRIGMATLKGISCGLNIPLVSVSTLETYANAVDNYDGAVVSVIDARKKRWYIAAFEVADGKVKRITEDMDGAEDNLKGVLSGYENILVTGPDCAAFAPLLDNVYPNKTIIVDDFTSRSVPYSIIDIAVRNYNEKGADDIGQGPSYIRRSDAEEALEQKKNGESV